MKIIRTKVLNLLECSKKSTTYDEDKNYCKGTCHKICKKHTRLKEIPIIFHNGSNYDYHFIINQLAISFRSYGSF